MTHLIGKFYTVEIPEDANRFVIDNTFNWLHLFLRP